LNAQSIYPAWQAVKQTMDRKNINRGFKKLRVWQEAMSLYVLACKIFANFPIFQADGIKPVPLKVT
jgi:hypothetical protein